MPSLTLIIGSRRYSSWSLRPWLALRQAGLPFGEVVVPLRRPETKAEILKHSPSGKVPVLLADGLAIWDSLAICEYAAELAPELWPAEPMARAVARSVGAEMHAGFQALRQTMPMDVPASTPMADIPADCAADIARVLALWADCRARFGAGGPFLFGRFSVADAMYAPVVTRFATYGVPLPPLQAEYAGAILGLPAMRDWCAAAAGDS